MYSDSTIPVALSIDGIDGCLSSDDAFTGDLSAEALLAEEVLADVLANGTMDEVGSVDD